MYLASWPVRSQNFLGGYRDGGAWMLTTATEGRGCQVSELRSAVSLRHKERTGRLRRRRCVVFLRLDEVFEPLRRRAGVSNKASHTAHAQFPASLTATTGTRIRRRALTARGCTGPDDCFSLNVKSRGSSICLASLS